MNSRRCLPILVAGWMLTAGPVAGRGLAAEPLAGEPLAGEDEPNDPEHSFEVLWRTFDHNYGLFGAKRIDWQALYRIYRPRVGPETTDDELFDLMSSLLGHLNDNHVTLTSADRGFQSGILGAMTMEDFSLELVKEKYLKGTATQAGEIFHYGWLGDSIGYLHFRAFEGRRSVEAIDRIVRQLKDARGVIIDVRGNDGGDDWVGQLIAGRFADRKRLYMTSRERNGPGHDDFTPPKYWYVEPAGPLRYTGPVILLTHRFSISAAEKFALALRQLPHVTVVGDTTSGVVADVYPDLLPNGWRFRVSYKHFLDADGFCWEGVGIPADIRQVNTPEDLAQGRDRVLELAITLLESGALESGALVRRRESSDPEPAREAVTGFLRASMESGGIEAGIAAYRQARDADPGRFYLDEDDFDRLGRELLREGKTDAAIPLYRLLAEERPDSHRAHARLGEAYSQRGDTEKSRSSYRLAMVKNRRSYPWELWAYAEADRASRGVSNVARLLWRAIERDGLDSALEAYRQLRRQGPETYYLDERMMNRLGYGLLRQEEVAAAIAVFEINAEEFPESWNVWDSLGEAYAQKGEKEVAIRHYERSIRLHPGNTTGIEKLEQLRQ